MANSRLNQFVFPIALSVLAALGFSARQETPPSGPDQTTPASVQAAVLSPAPGQVLQGSVPIQIRTDLPGFLSTELSFAYSDDPTDTWFQLYESNQPAAQAAVIEWDTAAITDGDYSLRLLVLLNDGGQQVIFVPGLRVRNYTLVETATAAPPPADIPSPMPTDGAPAAATRPASQAAPTLTPSTPSATPAPATPTPGAARNPAEIQPGQVGYSATLGALAAAGMFILAGIFWSLKRLGRRS